ncbi:MAG: ADP-heptose:LPS heptosyltransferase-like protein [uncultured bacterium]|nr:MAG: ADP-heptose:LPS heptosyltransferase-like protein [uncultured bacterium]
MRKYQISGFIFRNSKFIKIIFYYLVYSYLLIYDFASKAKKNKKCLPIKNPKKILISNIAALGDTVITSSIIPFIKNHFPNAMLFFLCNSYSKPLTEKLPSIYKAFCFDHLRHNRQKISFIKKIIKHYQTRRSALNQIKKEKIDLAIDFHVHNPNAVKLLHKAKIKSIAAYTCAGYKNLLTHKVQKPFIPIWHLSQYFLYLLNSILEKKEKITPLTPNLPDVKEPVYKELKKYENKNYILIHIGASHKTRYIKPNQIRKILKIIPEDNLVLFIGSGIEEQKVIEKMIKNRTNCINLANKLHVLDLIYLCNNAQMVISSDSAISHIASCFDYPQIVFFYTPYIPHHNLWALNKPNIRIVAPKKENQKKVFKLKFLFNRVTKNA